MLINADDKFTDMKKSKPYFPFSLLRVFAIAGCIWLLIFKYTNEHPKAEWDTSPDNVVISFEPGIEEIDYGYIPDFRVWGDGHIVWVEHDSDYARKVLEGYLSQDNLKKLIEKFVDAGFFNWFEYGGSSISSISIQLLNRNQLNALDANNELSKLVDYLKSGAGVNRREFVPIIGYLYVFPITETEYANLNVTPYSWAVDKFEFTLEGFENKYPTGKEITGDELDLVWQIVNHSSVVEANGKRYWIALRIPKITN